MLFHHSTSDEVGSYLERSWGVLVPIGSSEQHGPNGLIGTDAICAEVIARAVCEALRAIGRLGGSRYTRTRDQIDMPRLPLADWEASKGRE